jgi:hypothetical protein
MAQDEVDRQELLGSLWCSPLRCDRAVRQEWRVLEPETRALEHRRRAQILAEEREAQWLAHEIEALHVDGVMIAKRAEHDLKKDLIETEQVTAIATAVSHMLQGASLTVYGEDVAPLTSLMPAFDFLSNRLRQALAREPKSET